MADWVTISALATAGGTLVLSPGSGRSPRRAAAVLRHWQVDRADPR